MATSHEGSVAWRDELTAYLAAEAASQRATPPEGPGTSLRDRLGGSRYEYQPLDAAKNEIRVLFIHDFKRFNDPMEASIHVGSLDDWPVHDCLSYVWGTRPPERLMLLNGKPFEITVHLQMALQRYRWLDGGQHHRMIWVDAICINQYDASEKSQQVQMMRQIYERAQTTYAYIGERRPGGPSVRGLELLDPRHKIPGGPKEMPRSSEAAAEMWRKHGVDETEAKHAVVEMLTRPWFRRAWVIQEGSRSLNVHVLYGGARFSLVSVTALQDGWTRTNLGTDNSDRQAHDDMNDSARALLMMAKIRLSWTSHNPTFQRTAFERHMQSLQRLLESGPDRHKFHVSDSNGQMHVTNTEDGSTLLRVDNETVRTGLLKQEAGIVAVPYRLIDVLRDFSFTKATNQRDKIYALLGLASDVHDAPAIDYKLSEEEVFLQFASYLIGKGHGIAVLQQAVQNLRHDRPCWVPTWSEGELRRHSFYFEIDHPAEYGAGGEFEPLVYLEDAESAVCTIHGRIIDTITEVSDVPSFLRTREPAARQQLWLSPLSSWLGTLTNMMKLPLCDHDGKNVWYNYLEAATNDNLHREIQQFDATSRTELLAHLVKFTNQMLKWKFHSMYEEGQKRTNTYEVEAAEARSETRDPLEAMFSFLFDPARISESAFQPAEQRNKFPYRNTVPRMLHGRRICFTAEGYMGVVPSEAAAGDVIAVIAGAQMPFVLRDAADGSGGFLLKGDGYLRGFMHGEGISETAMREIRLV